MSEPTLEPQTGPKPATAFVVKSGDARKLLVAGQALHMLAGTAQTNGAYGAVICESVHDKRPIPLHYHDREHDTWLCLRGRLQVWANDSARVLTEGDFAYVQPGDVHSYQCVAPLTRFFGIVAPGGWEGFFDMAGEPWEGNGLPELDHPYDFSKMGPAMGKFDVHPVQQDFAPVANGDATDRVLPEGPASYVLQAGQGARYRFDGHLATVMLNGAISAGALDMVTLEAGRGAAMPALRHATTHVCAYLMDGALELVLDGETHLLHAGDFANIPAGTAYATRVVSGSARWVLTGGNGNGVSLWSRIGTATDVTSYQARSGLLASEAVSVAALEGVDAALV
ncbi:Quercetin 2,3-dioxygenase [Aquimixticola soesokkakensis]|uniref:Quercetin 2,3-dioxygenase n=1 Tax=Aquimixticola soesokkakensis TaxID=1519096 RepID=A0A1Y5TB82_9RHOB|nr:quercetin 2,3-dioxygenase family protein [Aquimixticola soesokkakensis]SLN60150.1 Quercetin 2,3-dioxygenase [Aquimixticola soesokkakensis]